MITNEEKRWYARGYNCAAKAWPKHRPPEPPQEEIAGLIRALQSLRDECDAMCATLGVDDEFVLRLVPQIDAADVALSAISNWLQSKLEDKTS